jgi:cold shock CspA family protein
MRNWKLTFFQRLKVVILFFYFFNLNNIRILSSDEVVIVKGTVKWYNLIEGSGSFRTKNGEEFLFKRKVLPVGTFLDVGDRVEFDIVGSDKGQRVTFVKKI